MSTTTESKAGLKGYALGRRDQLMIDPRVIVIAEGFNARDFSIPENQAHVEFLKTSIIEVGLKEPLTVRLEEKRVVLVGGESRLRAVMQAIEEGHEIVSIPCQPDAGKINDAERVADIILRNSGRPLTPLEQANVVRRLSDFGWDQTKIAKRLSMSASNVSHLLGLLTMPEEAQQMVRQGEVSAVAAAATVRAHGKTNGVSVLREAVGEAKAAGKKKASGSAVKSVAARREPTGKPMGLTLNSVKTDKVMTFLRWAIASAESAVEIKAKADELLTEILR